MNKLIYAGIEQPSWARAETCYHLSSSETLHRITSKNTDVIGEKDSYEECY
jgi:hypothetical protein